MIYNNLINKLNEREISNNPIKLAVAGTGFIGRGLINQVNLMKGIRTVAVANRNIDKAIRVLKQVKSNIEYSICKNENELNKTIKSGKIGVISDPLLLVATDADIVIDCIGDTEIGAQLAMAVIESGKHFIASPEMDATVGPALNKLAIKKGVTYSGADGDEPGVIMGLYNYVSMLGLDIIAAGKFKGYYNRFANPSTVKPWSDKLAQNPIKIASYADGTKMSIEMALVANATGLVPDIRGMHCPHADLDNVSKVLNLKGQGGILSSTGVIEVVQGAEPSGGVFVVANTTHPQIKKDLQYYKMGNGPNYLFYRPYHIGSVEMGIGVIRAVLNNETTISPIGAPVADVLAVAKRDLLPGEILDSIGGYDYYGIIDRSYTVKEEKLLSVGMASGAKIIKHVKADTPITLDDVEVDDTSVLWKLRKLYEEMI